MLCTVLKIHASIKVFGGPLRIGLRYLPFVPPLYVVGNHTYVIPNKATDIEERLTDMQMEIDLLNENMKKNGRKMEKEMKEMKEMNEMNE